MSTVACLGQKGPSHKVVTEGTMERCIIEDWISMESILAMTQALAELCPERDPLARGQPIAGLDRQQKDANEMSFTYHRRPKLGISKLRAQWLRTPFLYWSRRMDWVYGERSSNLPLGITV